MVCGVRRIRTYKPQTVHSPWERTTGYDSLGWRNPIVLDKPKDEGTPKVDYGD